MRAPGVLCTRRQPLGVCTRLPAGPAPPHRHCRRRPGAFKGRPCGGRSPRGRRGWHQTRPPPAHPWMACAPSAARRAVDGAHSGRRKPSWRKVRRAGFSAKSRLAAGVTDSRRSQDFGEVLGAARSTQTLGAKSGAPDSHPRDAEGETAGHGMALPNPHRPSRSCRDCRWASSQGHLRRGTPCARARFRCGGGLGPRPLVLAAATFTGARRRRDSA